MHTLTRINRVVIEDCYHMTTMCTIINWINQRGALMANGSTSIVKQNGFQLARGWQVDAMSSIWYSRKQGYCWWHKSIRWQKPLRDKKVESTPTWVFVLIIYSFQTKRINKRLEGERLGLAWMRDVSPWSQLQPLKINISYNHWKK